MLILLIIFNFRLVEMKQSDWVLKRVNALAARLLEKKVPKLVVRLVPKQLDLRDQSLENGLEKQLEPRLAEKLVPWLAHRLGKRQLRKSPRTK
jgi:hypothetical protein